MSCRKEKLLKTYVHIATDITNNVDDGVVGVLQHLWPARDLGQQILVGGLSFGARLQTNLHVYMVLVNNHVIW